MSEFYKRFLMEDGRRLSPENGRYVALAAFGKHPGWDDHVEDLGLETDSLNLAKLVLYVQGVGGQIDTGAWEKLKAEHRIGAFNHTFVWQRGDQFLLGRMWSSSDGKGRTRYPMILCAHFSGVPLAWALQYALPRLEDAEKACQATKAAEEVRSILARARAALRNSINDPGVESARATPGASVLNQFVSAPAFGAGKEGWFRILYWLQSQAKTFGPGQFSLKGDLSGLRAQQFRVPTGMPSRAQAVLLWARFLTPHIDRQVPALFTWPADQGWMDVTFGEPSSHEFFCLRASLEAVPLATDIPYDFDQAFRDRAAQQLVAFQGGSTQLVAAPAAAQESSDTGASSDTKRWFKSLTGKFFLAGLLLVALSVLAVVMMRAGSGSGGKPGPQLAANAIPDAPPVPAESGATQKPVNDVQQPNDDAAEQAKAAAEAKRIEEQKRQRAEAAAAQAAAAEAARLKSDAEAKERARLAAETQRLEDQKRLQADASAKAKTAADTAQLKAEAQAKEKARLDAEARRTEEQARQAQANTITPPAAVSSSATAAAAPAEPVAIASAPAASVPADKAITNGIGMAMLWVAGLPGSGAGGWVGKYEVRQAEYQKIAGANPSKFTDPDEPVESVTWREAMDFCQKLTAAESAAGRLPEGFAYALPTQAQWDFFLGDAAFENAVTSRDLPAARTGPARVGTKLPNQFGLHDVLGNVWEWCADSDSDQKVLKGGAYDNGRSFQFKPLDRTTARRLAGDARSPDAGFRCVAALRP